VNGSRTHLLALLLSALGAASSAPLAAQSGEGTTTAGVLALPGGGRAAGMGGAYVAGTDVDALFYNPASASWLDGSAGVSYQRHVEDIGFATAAGGGRIGAVGLALSIGYLDFGAVPEVRPDPDYGGQRGRETGEQWGASEAAARATVAIALLDNRLSVGASAGILYINLAETGRTAPIFDGGVQYRISPGLTAGAALRNAGADLTGARLADAPLPSEIRAGIAWLLPVQLARATTALANIDVIGPLRDGRTAPAVGIELRHAPPARALAAALRAGYNAASGSDALGRMHLGAGIDIDGFAFDYAYQDMALLGAVHRLGVRWHR
jgi:hypothetical protein